MPKNQFDFIIDRYLGQSIMIGPDIQIKVLMLKKGICKLGIEAPSDKAIWRAELLPLTKENPCAVKLPPPTSTME